MNSIADILSSLSRDGVRLWVENGQLFYQAPKGIVTSETIEGLRKIKVEMMEFLERLKTTASGEPPLVPRLDSDRVPFTFTQQFWWAAVQPFVMIGDIPECDIRFCAEAKRIYGRLHIESLRKSLEEVIRRHESLRTKMVVVEGIPIQEVDELSAYALEVIDLTGMSTAAAEAEAKRIVDELVYKPIGPWFVAKVLKLGGRDHVFVAAMHHLISDAASVGILSRDIWTLYTQCVQGIPLALPKMPIQFPDYAVWQQKAKQWWMDKHGGYWKDRLADAPGVQFPPDEGIRKISRAKYAYLPLQFGKNISVGLRELSRRERTTLVMSFLATYAAVVLRWQEKRDLVVRFLVTGRDRPELENTIGFLASVLNFRVQINEEDTFLSLLTKVANEHNMAYKHNDFGRMSVPPPRFEFQRSTFFNWLPRDNRDHNAPEFMLNGKLEEPDNTLRLEAFPITPFTEMNLDHDVHDVEKPPDDPGVMLWDSVDGVSGFMSYRSDLFKLSTIERFGRNFILFAERFLERPQARLTAASYT